MNSHSLASVCVAVLALASSTFAIASEETAKLDSLIAAAASAQVGQPTKTALSSVAAEIERLAADITNAGGTPADVLSARSRLVEAIEKGNDLEVANNVTEAVRLLSRATTLSAAIADTETPDAKGVKTVDAVTRALYDRTVKTGAKDENVAPVRTVKPGERLVFRIYFAKDQTLTSAELVGNDKTRKMDWRQSVLPSGALNRDIKSNSGAETAKFALVYDRPKGLDAPAAASKFSKTATAAAYAGLLPLAVEATDSPAPITALPAVAAARAGKRQGNVELVHLQTGAIVAAWDAPLDAALVSSALAIASEVGGDLGVELKPLEMTDFLNRETASSATGRFYAVADRMTARLAGADGTFIIEPWFALEEKARLEPGWSRYGISGLPEEVWLKTALTGTFIQFPETMRSAGLWATLKNALSKPPDSKEMIVSKEASLRARPYPQADLLAKLPKDSEATVLFEQPKDEDGKLWTFVRSGTRLGWLDHGALKTAAASLDGLDRAPARTTPPGKTEPRSDGKEKPQAKQP